MSTTAQTSRLSELANGFAGTIITAADAAYDEARTMWNGAIDKRPAVIAQCTTPEDVADVIAAPVTPTPGFKLGELINDPLAMYLVDLYTVSANLAGLPGICLPCGQSTSGLPIDGTGLVAFETMLGKLRRLTGT